MKKTSAKCEKIVLRPGVQLIEFDHPNALFSYYGNPHFQKFTGLSFPLEEVLSFLSSPRDLKSIKSKFSSVPNFLENFQLLNEEELFVQISEDTFRREKLDPFVHFCSHFYHSLDLSENALQRCAEQSLIIIDHLDLGKKLKESFKRFRLKQTTVFKCHSDITKTSMGSITVLSSWHHLHELKVLNRWCMENKREYYLVLFDMFGGSIGPLLGRRHGPCFVCLQLRRNSNLESERRGWVERLETWASNHHDSVEIGIFEPFSKIIVEFAAIEVFKKIANLGSSGELFGMKEIDLLNIRTKYHEILPTPSCPMCFPRNNVGI